MASKVFVLGRSGSGKSTTVNRLIEVAEKQGWAVASFNDYDILYRMFLADVEHKQFRPIAYGGFEVLDLSVFDIALWQLEQQVCSLSSVETTLIIIEFARDDYEAALKCFSAAFLRDACYLYVAADLPTCSQRICQRVAHCTSKDNCFLSETFFLKYFSHQYMPACIGGHKVNILDNTDTLETLGYRVKEFFQMLLSQAGVVSV